MAQTTSLVFNGGVIPSPSPAPSGNGKAKLLKIGEITVTEQEVQVTKKVICDPDSVTTVAPFMEVLTSARLAELVQANNILVLDNGTMQYLMSDASIAVEEGTAVCTAVNFLGLSKENRAKVLYPCTRLTDELTLQQVIEVGEPVETGFDLVKAYPEDTEGGTLIDKLEIEDTIDDDPDYQPLLAIVPTDGKVAINEDGLHEVLSELGGGIDNIVDTISEMDMDSVPHAYLHSTLNQSAGDSSTTRTTIDIFACNGTPEGDCFEFEQTTTIDDTPYGYLWVEPGTYLINGSVTLQWVGDPRGTFVAKVGSVMGENFDFSQEQEILRNHTKIVTIPNRMKLAINVTYDAGTPVMGFWIQSLQVVKLAGGMSQTNIMHDSTLTGEGSVSNPLGVDEAKVAQSALAGNLAPAFDPTRTASTKYLINDRVMHDGVLYRFINSHYGAWSDSDVTPVDDDTSEAVLIDSIFDSDKSYKNYAVNGCCAVDGTISTVPVGWKTYHRLPVRAGDTLHIENLEQIAEAYTNLYANICVYSADGTLAEALNVTYFSRTFTSDGFISVTEHKSAISVVQYNKVNRLSMYFEDMLGTYKVPGAIDVSELTLWTQPGEPSQANRWFTYHLIPIKKGDHVSITGMYPINNVQSANVAVYDSSYNLLATYSGADYKFEASLDGFVSVTTRASVMSNTKIKIKDRSSGGIGSFSIVGDSYSTYTGYNPAGNNTYYPENMALANGVFDTWWFKLATETNSPLFMNESLSGATISNKVRPTQDVSVSFVNRILNGFGSGQITDPKPKVIFFFGGTNDSWVNTDHGQVQYSGWTETDLLKTVNAFCYCIDTLLKYNPGVRVVNIVNTGLNATIVTGMRTACEHYGIDNIELVDIDKSNGHPTTLGMSQICEQIRYYLE